MTFRSDLSLRIAHATDFTVTARACEYLMKRSAFKPRTKPMRRSRPKKQPPERRDDAVIAFTRRRRCCCCNHPPPSHAHHPRTGTGTGIKAADNTVIPLCSNCHADLHALSGSFKGWVREQLREWEHSCNAALLADYAREASGEGSANAIAHPLYTTWQGMKSRCSNQNNAKYARYGGRGITVCDRWRESFAAFLEDMGPRPSPKHSLDRVNNDGNYEPRNVRWATAFEQARNSSAPAANVVFGDRELRVADAARVVGIKKNTLYNRRIRGLSGEALFAPVRTPGGTCSVPGCGRPLRCRGLCDRHYQAQRKAAKVTLRVVPLLTDVIRDGGLLRESCRIVALGRDQSVAQWAREAGISARSIIGRIKNGWPADRAVTTPEIPRAERCLMARASREANLKGTP